MKTCPLCGGSGKGQPASIGMESSWRINQWLMSQPCSRCEGKGEIADREPTNTTQDEEDQEC